MKLINIDKDGFLKHHNSIKLIYCPLHQMKPESNWGDLKQCGDRCAWFNNTDGELTCGDKIIGRLCK